MTDSRVLEAHERALAAVRQIDWPAAAVAFWEVCRLAPEDVKAWYNLANARHRADDHVGALPAIGRALDLDPKWPNLQLLAANVFMEHKQYESAIVCYLHAIEQNPTSMIASINLAIVFEQVGWHEEAYECYDTAILLGADRSLALSAMHYAAQQAGRWDLSASAQARFTRYLEEGGANRAAPFQLLTMDSTRAMQLESARAYATKTFGEIKAL